MMYSRLRGCVNDSEVPEKATSNVPHGWKCRECHRINHWVERRCFSTPRSGPCPGPDPGEKTDSLMIYNEAHVYLGCGYVGVRRGIPEPAAMSVSQWHDHLLTVMRWMRKGTHGYGNRDWGAPRGFEG